MTEALAMEDELKLGDQPVNLVAARALLGTPDIDLLETQPLDDSFEFLRYLVDPRLAENLRQEFTVEIEGDGGVKHVLLRNSVIVITDAGQPGQTHLAIARADWAAFIAGQTSFADRDPVLAKFEAVLARPSAAGVGGALDEQFDEAIESEDIDHF